MKRTFFPYATKDDLIPLQNDAAHLPCPSYSSDAVPPGVDHYPISALHNHMQSGHLENETEIEVNVARSKLYTFGDKTPHKLCFSNPSILTGKVCKLKIITLFILTGKTSSKAFRCCLVTSFVWAVLFTLPLQCFVM